MSVGLATSMLQNIIDQTDIIMMDVINGTTPSENVLIVWRDAMAQMGFVEPVGVGGDNSGNNTGGGGGQGSDNASGGGGSDNVYLTFDTTALLQEIQTMLNSLQDTLYSQLQNVMLASNNVAISTINTQFNSLRGEVQKMQNDEAKLLNDSTQLIIETIENSVNTSDNSSGLLLSDVQQLFINQHNRLEQTLEGTIGDIENKIQVGNDQILQGLDQLGLEIKSSGVSNDNVSGWTSGYIVDLLGLIDNIRMFLETTDFSTTITNEINVNGGGGSGTDGTDSSAGVGGLFDPLGADQYMIDFLNGQGLLDGDNDNLPKDAMQLLMLWGKGHFNSVTELETAFNNAGIGGSLFKLLWSVLGGLFLFVGMGGAVSEPYLNNMTTLARRDALDNLLGESTLTELWIRKLENRDWLGDQFEKLGLSGVLAESLIKTAQVQLQDYYLRTLYLRDKIDEQTHDNGMEKLGYLPNDIPLIKETYQQIPPLSDLILFMKRDVYDDSASSELGWDDDYDIIKQQFESDLKKHGIDSNYAKYYYRASWTIPPLNQSYDMFHRGIIDQDLLELILRIDDYPKFWRDKLIDLSYKLLTRVDVRRMHSLGLITDQRVKEEYQKQGLSPDDADLMTQFTIAYNNTGLEGQEKELTKTQILKAFKVGAITDIEAKDKLKQLGFSDNAINLMLQVSLLEIQSDINDNVIKDNRRRIVNLISTGYIQGTLNETSARQELLSLGYTPDNINLELSTLRTERRLLLQEEKINQLKTRFIKYRINDLTLRSELQILGFDSGEQNEIVNLWITLRDDNTKSPTLATITRWFKTQIITETRYVQYLREHDYDNETIGYFIAENM